MSFHDRLLDRKGRKRVARPLKKEKLDLFVGEGLGRAGELIGKSASHRENPEALQIPQARFEKQVDLLSHPPFSVRSLAKRWLCSESTVRNEISANRLGHFRIGGLVRVSAAEVARFECQE